MREIAEQVLRAAQLTYRVGSRPLVSEIDFALRSGEVVAMLGPNGAGKSTILKLLCGQLRPSSGTVILVTSRFSNGRRETCQAPRGAASTWDGAFRVFRPGDRSARPIPAW